MLNSEDNALIAKERARFHAEIIKTGILGIDAGGIATNADKHSTTSVGIAANLARRLMSETSERQAGQTSGSNFEMLLVEFVKRTFLKLQHIRPGEWEVTKLGMKTSSFVQYEHLEYLQEIAKVNAQLKTILGNDYMVAPDVVVYRHPIDDDEINRPFPVVNGNVSTKTELRATNNNRPLLLASISAKWTMRSDRAQNSRTEALNLIRNRRGQTPHIIVVTGEPMPSRIASLALGTGDIDCVYHFALYELIDAVNQYGENAGRDDIIEQLGTLIEGKRLKDISDLPFDLCL